jgi:signal transduction histidine kinase/Na+-transporting methylmalonyl-CoA/oxaloacetate decarboxylase gamma subunit
MKFRNRILLAIWGVVLVLLVVFYVVLQSWMRSQVESRFVDDLRRSHTILDELHALRSEQDKKACQIIAESPRLKAVVELGDRQTAFELVQELGRGITQSVIIVTNGRGEPLVRMVDGRPASIDVDRCASIRKALGRGTFAGGWQIDNAPFQCISTPLLVGDDLIGTLTIGYRIDTVQMRSVKSMTNSEVILVVDTLAVSSTLSPDQTAEFSSWMRDEQPSHRTASPAGMPATVVVPTSVDNYAVIFSGLNNDPSYAGVPMFFLLAKPIEREVRQALEPVMRTFLLLSVITLIVTAGIGFVISRGISRPIATLVRGTAEISRGNYEFPITIVGGGELNFLAGKFKEMSQSLKEKISQLAERNTELEEALGRLKSTQQELVKSERLAATGKLTAQLSHEINNPIHNVQSCLQTALKRMSPDSPDRELIEVAYEEVQRLGKLTRQMLDVYRTSMVQEPRTPTSINDVLREVLHSSAAVLEQHRIGVLTQLQDDLPPVLAAADKLKQVFLNLIINAKDAMPGGGTLTIGTSRRDGTVVITIGDTGIGIPPENVNRIFDAFFTTKSSVSGVGLGLFVTYGIVRQHEGSISVRSVPDHGTTFDISLPVINTRKAVDDDQST